MSASVGVLVVAAAGSDHRAVTRTPAGQHRAHGHAHAHGPGHGHHGTATGRHRRRLVQVLVLTLAVVVVQVVGGLLSGSLALLADAGHMLTDATGVGDRARRLRAGRASGDQRPHVRPAARRDPRRARQRAPARRARGVGPRRGGGPVGGPASGRDRSHARRRGRRGGGEPRQPAAAAGRAAGRASTCGVRTSRCWPTWVARSRCSPRASSSPPPGTPGRTSSRPSLIGLLILPRAWSLLREVVDVLLEATPAGIDLDDVRRHIRESNT